MGFIDYHGTKERRYDEVVEYAELQREREQNEKFVQQKMTGFAERMGDQRFLLFDANAILRQTHLEYRKAVELFRSLALKPADGRIDTSRLWKDLWYHTAGRYVLAAGIPEGTAEKLLQFLLVKCLKVETPGSEILHFQMLQSSRRYRRHMQAFSLTKAADFWKMLYVYGKAKRIQNTVSLFLDAYGRCITCMAYYLCMKRHTSSEKWENTLAEDLDAIREQQELLERSKQVAALPPNFSNEKSGIEEAIVKDTDAAENVEEIKEKAVVCWERLADPVQEPPHQHITYYARELLFHRRSLEHREENEMIDDLYAYLKEVKFYRDRISSILPEHIVGQIQNGTLPVLEDPSVSGLDPGEQIHYIEHGTLFWNEARVEAPFTQVKGVMVVTDKRVAFRGARSLDVGYEKLNRIIRYDMTPEVLELECDQNSFFLTVSSTEAAYQILKLIADRRAGGDILEEKTVADYAALVEKADIGACIFAYECLENYDFPSELKGKIALLVKKLNGLKRTLEFHPERTEETERFLSYYIPEGVRIVVSFHEQQSVNLPAKMMQSLYAKITDSIDTLDAAIEKKILSIYQFEMMDTAAKADALRQILEQDGYFKANQVLTC